VQENEAVLFVYSRLSMEKGKFGYLDKLVCPGYFAL
jgi:hypothetical protein